MTLRSIKSTIESSLAYRWLDRGSVWAALTLGRLSRRTRPTGDVLLLTPGGSNTGDQAMYDSAVEALPLLEVVVCPTEANFDHSGTASSGYEVLVSPSLLRRPSLSRARELFALGTRLATAKRFFVIGADVMDGGYSAAFSRRTWSLCRWAARRGASVTVLGFSWNGSPPKVVLQAAKKAMDAQIVACLRDPLSYQRFTNQIGPARLVSDIVFGLRAQSADSALERLAKDLRRHHQRIALLNASGLIEEKLQQLEEYRVVVDYLLDLGYAVVLVPHVTMSGSDDRLILSRIAASYADDPRVRLLADRISPADTRAGLDLVDLVFTGRMHLSVMALSRHVPSLVLATQGKVEGLMDLIGHPEYCIEPRAGFGSACVATLQSMHSEIESHKDSLRRVVPRVIRLAELNWPSELPNPVNVEARSPGVS